MAVPTVHINEGDEGETCMYRGAGSVGVRTLASKLSRLDLRDMKGKHTQGRW